MKWINALDLGRWGQTNSARVTLPRLVGDLIRASAKEISAYRFPSDDKGQLRGFDGYLEADKTPPYVPEGLSIWEFGVTANGTSKALKDYRKRVDEVPAEQREKITFVFVSTASWDNPKKKLPDWVKELQDKNEWKDVRYLDGVQLEDWLALCPAVASRYAPEIGTKPQNGARSTQEFWHEYSHRFKTPITEEVVLAGREKQAETLLQDLLGPANSIRLAADAPDEVIAFAIAAVRKADRETRTFLEDRILILDTEEAARFFSSSTNLIFFPRAQANSLSGSLAYTGPTLIAAGRNQSGSINNLLNRPSTYDFSLALKTMGFETDEAERLSRHSGRSLTVLSRQYPGGNVELPEWQNMGRELLPAVLAGGWDASKNSDKEAITNLTGDNDYWQLERTLRVAAKLQDPPIDLEGDIWKIRAPVDAFVPLGHLIDETDLQRLKSVFQMVFADIGEPPQADQPYVTLDERPTSYSTWLRDGLANTLLQISVLSEQAEINVAGTNPKAWVEAVIDTLPGLKENHRLIASLKNELWMLMEAAPNPLLSALEHLLGGNGEKAKPLFAEGDAYFSPTSPHNYVLWALETLAWDPEYLERVSRILMKLVHIDVEGKTANRPINSLRSIFLSWSPNTHANLQLRNQVLEDILHEYSDVAWELVLRLLPKSHDNNISTRKPRFREAGASQAEVLTFGKVWEAQALVVRLALNLVTESSDRWKQLLPQIGEWPIESQMETLDILGSWLQTYDGSKSEVWQTLNNLANHNIAFADAEWALKPEVMLKLNALVEESLPKDVIERSVWLFDIWSPQMGANFGENEEAADRARSEAVGQIIQSRGISGIFTLLERAAQPGLIALATEKHLSTLENLRFWIESALSEATDKRQNFASVLSFKAYERNPQEWKTQIQEWSNDGKWPPALIAQLVMIWPDETGVWEFIENLGAEHNRIYWQEKRAFKLNGTSDELEWAINKYIEMDRADAALRVSSFDLSELSTSTLLKMLKSFSQQTDKDTPQDSVDPMISYYVEEIFKEIDNRADATLHDVASMEYYYFPLLKHTKRELHIHKIMASSPSFYFSIIKSIFRAKHEKEDELKIESTEKQRAKWKTDYQLLSEFHTVPGAKGDHVGFDELFAWVSEVRSFGENEDRKVITDVYIGHLLAHSPNDVDGAWPHKAVRNLIEILKAENVERGIWTERLNMRGVYSKLLYEGGEQERELASKYHAWAEAMPSSPRTAALLDKIGETYEKDAAQADHRAELDKLRD